MARTPLLVTGFVLFLQPAGEQRWRGLFSSIRLGLDRFIFSAGALRPDRMLFGVKLLTKHIGLWIEIFVVSLMLQED